MTPRERYEAACARLLYVTKAAWVRWEDMPVDGRLTWGAGE